MLNRKPMKTLLVLSLFILGFTANAQPTANAGPDQTIYLTQSSTATLNGNSSGGTSFLWSEVSTDYSSGGTITSPTSATTTVTGLTRQGVFYFSIAATTGGTTVRDTMAITVNYSPIPGNAYFMVGVPFDSIAPSINKYSDTSINSGGGQWHYYPGYSIYYDRGRSKDMNIDNVKKKFKATVEDGYPWTMHNYGRAELSYGYGGGQGAPIDSNKTYLFEWKGYFPQNEAQSQFTSGGNIFGVTVFFQLHGQDAYSPPFQFLIRENVANTPSAGHNISFMEQGLNSSGTASVVTSVKPFAQYNDFYNQAHTIRVYLKEGKPGGNGFIKVTYDDATVYYRSATLSDTLVGRSDSWQLDWPKFGSVYDFDNRVADNLLSDTATARARGKKFSLVTLGYNEYTLDTTYSGNPPPVASAGTNQSITLPANSVSLSGSGTDAGGTITSYQWTKISGPSQGTISTPNSASTNVTGLVQGVYQFQLTVTDNKGATGKSTMQVIVNAANQPPTANAGSNQTITLPANSVSLSGSGSDTDGTIASYQWTKISGPTAYTMASPGSASTAVSGMVQGVYTFQLTVTDNGGAIGTSTVQITVNAAANLPPTANAGPNQAITLPTNSVNLSGSGSDVDGTIASYQWTKISGPSAYNIASPESASTGVSGLAQGVYTFQLTVTDNGGAIGTSTVQITVNAAANIPPTANAGSNQTVTLPTNSVSLSGSGSDADGTIASYQWTKISGPSAYTLASPGSASTGVSGLAQGVYTFQLTVTDNGGAIGTSTVQITVNAAANIPPTANAGSNQTITLPTNSVSLSGSGSDADGTIASYQWTKISGPSAYTLASPASASTGVSGLAQGVYTFQLTVTDNGGAIGTSTVQITVNAAANIPPTANAGSNQTITLPANSVSLSGSGSDTDGTIASYQWTMISGPATYNIVSSSSPVTGVSGLVQGVYQFQLTVTDNDGATGTATVQVTVNAAANIPPTANAGSNQAITLPTNSVILSGSGSDADGTIASYQWTKISGPSAYTMASPGSASTGVSGLVQGVYQFLLTVTDNDGAIGTSTVQITVHAAANIPPTANAGTDISINLPANSVSLTGSGSDADGTISSYQWTKISGPSAFTIVSPNSAATAVSGLVQGVYQFQLTVTDNQGEIGTATVQVAVNATPNIPPTANAGSNQAITLPSNSVSLTGSGSDADGTISSYQWSKISGPSSYNIVNPTSPVTDVSGLVQGVYQFQLTVTDNDGAIGNSTVQITVHAAANIPPTANAGSNQSITLPTSSISLSGSGSDTDGTIASYLWTKISGPSGYTIVSPNSAATNVSGLSQGVYTFQLTVTDNDGAIGTSTVQITVNAPSNIPPVANAGTNQTITLPVNSVTLSGSGSDADGTIASYQWTKISGPSTYNIVNASSPVTDVSGLVQGVYRFQLTVTDNNGAIGRATVRVTVNAAPNIPPSANAGSNQTITLPVNSVSLAGSGSDADGTIASYQWTKISGPSSYNLVNSSSPVTDVSGLVQGVYHFQLTVTDNDGAIGTAIVQVTVNAAANIPPIANAGSNQTITLPTNTVNLSGSGSDADGTIASYQWTKVSGPSAYTMASPESASTGVSGLVQGVYTFQLTVTDNGGAIGTSTVQITVNAAANIPPTANAGSNQEITLPTNSVSLSGSGSDADGTISSYQWTKISGPSSYHIVNASSPLTEVSGLVQGLYHFQLIVTDNDGATGTATVQVTVNAAANIPPTANAGSNQTITLPVNSVSLAGSGSDADGTISTYRWTKTSGPSSYNIVNSSSPVTDVSGLVQGVYQFQLSVTDNDGATGTSTVQITVNAAANIPPTANAGPNQTVTLPINSVSLAGSGSDADGTIASYQWTKTSGPSSYSIVNPSSPVTDVSGLVQGVYQFQLTVKDNKGATGTATVQVTVNAGVSATIATPDVAPVANAGNDTTIVYPDNSVTLNGGGTDADGNIVSYSWNQVSGPSTSTIFPNNTASTNVSNLVEGNYEFELTVTDSNGSKGKDSVEVIVASGRYARESNSVKVYPNPVQSIANLVINTAQANTDIKIVITDLTGKSVYTEEFVSSTNSVTKQIDMSNLIKGTYIITLYFDGIEKQSIKVLRM